MAADQRAALERPDRPQVELACFFRALAWLAVGDGAAIDLGYGRDATQGAGHEGFVRRVDLRQGEVTLARVVAALAPGVDLVGLGDALEAVEAGRGPELAAADDEEVRRIARGHEAARVEHQGLVG